MSTHRRLQKTMRNPVRADRRAGKRHSAERQRAYASYRVPLESLFEAVPSWRPRHRKGIKP